VQACGIAGRGEDHTGIDHCTNPAAGILICSLIVSVIVTCAEVRALSHISV
jgi:hypothetical protein